MKEQISEIPSFVTHYSRNKPFQSLSGLSNELIQSLDETKVWGLERFKDPEYMPRRIQTEKLIRLKFEKIGGRPALDYPIYFFLGKSFLFESHPLNQSFMLLLESIPSDLISFTYGDSLLSFDQKYKSLSGKKYQNLLCETVFRKENLSMLYSHIEFPKVEPLHIEAQLWAHPLTEWISLVREGNMERHRQQGDI